MLKSPPPRREIFTLSLLFGAMYFIQGIGEPTEGLIAQPVRNLLKQWGQSPAEITAFMAILALPWSIKPLFGLISDFLPIGGSRRRSYLLVTSLAATLGLLALYLWPPPEGARWWLLSLLLLPTVGVAFGDVVIDALMVEKGQPLGATGRLQAVQWASIYGATLLLGSLGGYLSQHHRADLAFLICGIANGTAFVIAWFAVREDRQWIARPSWQVVSRRFRLALSSRNLLVVGAFLFLWNFNPFSSSVLNLYMTDELKLSEQFYGNTVSVQAAAAMTASVAYGIYCRAIPFRWLTHLSIVCGILATLAYWGLRDATTGILISIVVGFTYMTATLVQLDLAARSCPREIAGTMFALLMSLSNFSVSLSMGLGGYWYEQWQGAWGNTRAFHVLVGVGALFTAGCWLMVPWLQENSGDAPAEEEG